MCSHILFIHTILGCDSTLTEQGLGKARALKIIIKNAKFRQLAQVFSGNKNNSNEDIIKAGEEALVCLFTGAEKDDLNTEQFALQTILW